jgi:hypothetical protein
MGTALHGQLSYPSHVIRRSEADHMVGHGNKQTEPTKCFMVGCTPTDLLYNCFLGLCA